LDPRACIGSRWTGDPDRTDKIPYAAVGDVSEAAEVVVAGSSVQVDDICGAGAAYAPSRGRAPIRNFEKCIVKSAEGYPQGQSMVKTVITLMFVDRATQQQIKDVKMRKDPSQTLSEKENRSDESTSCLPSFTAIDLSR
jgi:hypothetical protein